MKTILTLLSAAAVAMTFSTACSEHDHNDGSHSHAADAGAHTSPYPSCNEIAQKCHEFDTGDPGTIHDCHETAHLAKGEADCAPKKDECLRVCAEAKENAGKDAGSDGGT